MAEHPPDETNLRRDLQNIGTSLSELVDMARILRDRSETKTAG